MSLDSWVVQFSFFPLLLNTQHSNCHGYFFLQIGSWPTTLNSLSSIVLYCKAMLICYVFYKCAFGHNLHCSTLIICNFLNTSLRAHKSYPSFFYIVTVNTSAEKQVRRAWTLRQMWNSHSLLVSLRTLLSTMLVF